MTLSNEELEERGWSRCKYCGAIRSPYTGLDWQNHSDEDCLYLQKNGFIITPKEGPTTASNI